MGGVGERGEKDGVVSEVPRLPRITSVLGEKYGSSRPVGVSKVCRKELDPEEHRASTGCAVMDSPVFPVRWTRCPDFDSSGVENGHCSEIRGNADNTTLVCLVWDHRDENFSDPRQIQIYRKGEQPQTIASSEPIREWHFWSKGKQLAVHFGEKGVGGIFILYDLASGKQAESVSGVSELSGLPQWAKSQSQLDDESVPEGLAYAQQRTAWIAKVLKRLEGIQPGMTRKDLDRLLTTEGGLSTRFQRKYVFVDCPYIKVDVRFKARAETTDTLSEYTEDVIESVSKPYLEFSIAD